MEALGQVLCVLRVEHGPTERDEEVPQRRRPASCPWNIRIWSVTRSKRRTFQTKR